MFACCRHLDLLLEVHFLEIRNILKISKMLNFSCWSYDKTNKACQFVLYSNTLSLGWNANAQASPSCWHYKLVIIYVNIALGGIHYLHNVLYCIVYCTCVLVVLVSMALLVVVAEVEDTEPFWFPCSLCCKCKTVSLELTDTIINAVCIA